MNFNREGYSYNDRQSSIYDLTRMQPQAYWPANHLLMRIKHDQTEDIKFEQGDTLRQKAWQTLAGASEIRLDQIILTTDPQKDGRMFLKNGQEYKDFNLTTMLKGNAFGQQKVWLRSDKTFRTGIVVSLVNGQLLVDEVNNGKTKNLQKLALDKFDGIEPISVEQDKF